MPALLEPAAEDGPELALVGPEVARDAQVDLVGLVAELGLDDVLEVEDVVVVLDGDLEGREGLVVAVAALGADAHDHDVAVVVVEVVHGHLLLEDRRGVGADRHFICLRAAAAFLGRVNPLLRPRRRGGAAAAATRWRHGQRGDGGSSLVAASTAARCGDRIVARRRCDETFGAGARTDDRCRAIGALSAPGAFVCLQRPEGPS